MCKVRPSALCAIVMCFGTARAVKPQMPSLLKEVHLTMQLIGCRPLHAPGCLFQNIPGRISVGLQETCKICPQELLCAESTSSCQLGLIRLRTVRVLPLLQALQAEEQAKMTRAHDKALAFITFCTKRHIHLSFGLVNSLISVANMSLISILGSHLILMDIRV